MPVGKQKNYRVRQEDESDATVIVLSGENILQNLLNRMKFSNNFRGRLSHFKCKIQTRTRFLNIHTPKYGRWGKEHRRVCGRIHRITNTREKGEAT